MFSFPDALVILSVAMHSCVGLSIYINLSTSWKILLKQSRLLCQQITRVQYMSKVRLKHSHIWIADFCVRAPSNVIHGRHTFRRTNYLILTIKVTLKMKANIFCVQDHMALQPRGPQLKSSAIKKIRSHINSTIYINWQDGTLLHVYSYSLTDIWL